MNDPKPTTKLVVTHLAELWDKLKLESREDIFTQAFYNDKSLHHEMLVAGLGKFAASKEYTRADADDVPEGVMLYVAWGNGFREFQYGVAKYAHGKWWMYSDPNPYGNGRECAAPIFYVPGKTATGGRVW